MRHVFDSAAASPASFAVFCDELADFLAEACTCFMQDSMSCSAPSHPLFQSGTEHEHLSYQEHNKMPAEALEQLSDAAMDRLDGFMGDVVDGAYAEGGGEVAVRCRGSVCSLCMALNVPRSHSASLQVHGGPPLQGELWLSLHQEALVAFSVLPRLASAQAADRCCPASHFCIATQRC